MTQIFTFKRRRTHFGFHTLIPTLKYKRVWCGVVVLVVVVCCCVVLCVV